MSSYLRQLLAVIRVYEASWLVGLILAVYLPLLFVVGSNFAGSDLTYSKAFANFWYITPWNQLPTDPRGISSLSLNSNAVVVANSDMMYALTDQSPLRKPGGMPRLKHLVIYGSVSESQLIPLLEHLQLESLSITYLQDVGTAFWDALARQPLKSLEILSADDRFWESAKFPVTLETLVIRKPSLSQLPKDQTQLKPLLSLTHLRTLELHLRGRDGGGLRPADFEVIFHLPSLKLFYIDGNQPDMVQSELPNISVRPGTYRSALVSRVILLVTLSGLPLVLLLHVLSVQFATPASKLIPGFKSPHLLVAIALILVMITVQSLALIGYCATLPSVSLTGAVFIPAYILTYLLNRSSSFPAHVNLALAAPVVVCQVVLIALTTLLVPAETVWFLEGHRPDVTVVLLVLALFSLVGLAQLFDQLPRTLAEMTSSAVPFDVWDFKALQRWQWESLSKGQPNWQANFWSGGQRRRFEQATQRTHRSPRLQSLLWRASQMYTAAEFLLYMAIIMGVFSLFAFLFAPISSPGRVYLGAAAGQVFAFSLVIPSIILQMQRPHLVQHLLMSIGRRDWVLLVFRETARDLIPAAFLAIIGIAVLPYWNIEGIWPIWHLALFAAASLVLICAIQLILVTYPSWITFIAIFVLMFAGILLLPFIMVYAKDRTGPLGSGVFSWPATWWCLTLVMAVMAVRFAYHRWMTWELAKIST